MNKEFCKTKCVVRLERQTEYRLVENMIRNAFWNLSVPGCDEHYLAHIMRQHVDYIPELDFVLELDGQIIGNVKYVKAALVDENGEQKEILSFGPICIHPQYQRRGFSRILLEHSFQKAIELGYDLIVIYGNPNNYVSRGFKSCRRYNICVGNGIYPAALLVKELKPECLDGRKWFYQESAVYNFDSASANEFDSLFEPKEKKILPSQEEFYIHSHSIMK